MGTTPSGYAETQGLSIPIESLDEVGIELETSDFLAAGLFILEELDGDMVVNAAGHQMPSSEFEEIVEERCSG